MPSLSLHDPRNPGRISDANLKAVKGAFQLVISIAQAVSQDAGLAIPQVFDLWATSRVRKYQSFNRWNTYEWLDHKEEELARLPTRQSPVPYGSQQLMIAHIQMRYYVWRYVRLPSCNVCI